MSKHYRARCKWCGHGANWHAWRFCHHIVDKPDQFFCGCPLSAETVVDLAIPTKGKSKVKQITAALGLCLLALFPTQGKADPLSRLGVVATTHGAQVGASYTAVRSRGIDLDAIVLTSQSSSDSKGRDVNVQRHYQPALGVFVNIAHTNVSVGALSIVSGPSWRRLVYAVGVRL